MPRPRDLHFYGLTFAVLFLTALIEHFEGRLLIPQSHRLLLWVSSPNSPENSQQLADWYSLSHIIHGIAFYGLFHLLIRRRSVSVSFRFFLTAICECAWEIAENSSFIINRYRAQTAAIGYTGDTILNSVSDILFCLLGFALARRLPVRVTITLVLLLELLPLYFIRDNLTLNLIMLLHPSPMIKHWQMAP